MSQYTLCLSDFLLPVAPCLSLMTLAETRGVVCEVVDPDCYSGWGYH